MNRSPARSNTTDRWPRSIIVSKKAANSGARQNVHLALEGQDHLPIHEAGSHREVGERTVAGGHAGLPEDPTGRRPGSGRESD